MECIRRRIVRNSSRLKDTPISQGSRLRDSRTKDNRTRNTDRERP